MYNTITGKVDVCVVVVLFERLIKFVIKFEEDYNRIETFTTVKTGEVKIDPVTNYINFRKFINLFTF